MVLGIVQDASESNDPKKYARLSAGTLGVALWEWGQATGRLDFIRTADKLSFSRAPDWTMAACPSVAHPGGRHHPDSPPF